MMTDHTAPIASHLLALMAACALGLGILAGCQGNGEDTAPARQADKAGPTPGEAGQAEPGAAPDQVGPKGPPSIDNAGITEIPDDPALVPEGEALFAAKGCTACHQADTKVVGPPLGGVTERREPEWIARMILHPDQMLQKDPTAKELLAEHMTPMPNQGVTPEEARALMAYLDTLEQ